MQMVVSEFGVNNMQAWIHPNQYFLYQMLHVSVSTYEFTKQNKSQ